MATINNHLVIMAGGVGSRFWPMSTAECPKQFIDVLGTGKSLLQLTVERFGNIISPERVWVVTNKNYADIVAKQSIKPCPHVSLCRTHFVVPHCTVSMLIIFIRDFFFRALISNLVVPMFADIFFFIIK